MSGIALSTLLLVSLPSLILSYYEYSLLDITCYVSTGFCMLMLTTRFSMHDYDSVLSIHLCLSQHAIWLSHHHSPGSSDSPGFSCLGFGAWSLWILPVADLWSTAVAWIIGRLSRSPSFQAPCSALEFSCDDSEPPFVLFILVHLFIFSHLRLLVM